MNAYNWYETLIKPSWAPPAEVFGPVWAVLYALIIISFAKVFWFAIKRRISLLTALPFALNLVFNLIFTWLQFGLKNNVLAALDVLFVLVTLIWAMLAIKKKARWVALVNIPYLIWVSFATILQLSVTYLNW